MYFYDTCSLLNELHGAFDNKFLISSITLKELENIKTSAYKDPDVKFRARKLIHLLAENEDKYEVIPFVWEDLLDCYETLSDNNDSRIILTALMISQERPEDNIIFYTQDLCCYHIAKSVSGNDLEVKYLKENIDSEYTGFKVITLDEAGLTNFYDNLLNWEENPYKLVINQYLLIKDPSGECIDKYKFTENGYKQVPFTAFDSKMFGKVKPKDEYQNIAMDSLMKNQITMIRGAAGTGKSYLSFAYLFNKLEHREIDRIIIFCNTVATSGSAKLGFYPGTRDEKLLDSQIGNLLASKLGDKIAVEKMIEAGTLVLLPMSDIRGYDTTGMRAGIYISEAQNMDIELMRLALQRIGEDSICILDGDSDAQVDLPLYGGNNNGMRRVSEIFRGDPCYGEVTLQNIHRSHIAALAQNL